MLARISLSLGFHQNTCTDNYPRDMDVDSPQEADVMTRLVICVFAIGLAATSYADLRMPGDMHRHEEWQRRWNERRNEQNRRRLGLPPPMSIPGTPSDKPAVGQFATSTIEIAKSDGGTRLLIPRALASKLLASGSGIPGSSSLMQGTDSRSETGVLPMGGATIGETRTAIVGVLMSLACVSLLVLRNRARWTQTFGVMLLLSASVTLWYANSAHGDRIPASREGFFWKAQRERPVNPIPSTPPRNQVKLDSSTTVELTDGPHVVLLVGDGFPVDQLKRPPSPIGHSTGSAGNTTRQQGESVFKSARE